MQALLVASFTLAALPLNCTAIAQESAPAKEEPPPFGSSAFRKQMFAKYGMNKPSYTKKFDLSALPHYSPTGQVSGTVRVWGNNYIGDSDLASWWQKDFNKYQPGVKLEFNLPSAAIATASLYFDLADIGMDHEPSFYDYLGHLRLKGYEPTGISAVTGSYDIMGWQNTIVVVVNKANPISQMTMKQLDGVFGSARDGGWLGTQWHPEFSRGPEGNIRTWGQLGLTGDWADRRINVYGFSLRYATALEFSNKVLQSSDKWNEDLHAYGNWRRPDGTVYGEAAQIDDHMKKDPYGISYNRLNKRFPSELKALSIARNDGGPYVALTLETEQDRSYPLWGDQSFWISRKPGTKVDPKVREFITYVLSREGQELVERDGKYLPLTAEAVREGLAKME